MTRVWGTVSFVMSVSNVEVEEKSTGKGTLCDTYQNHQLPAQVMSDAWSVQMLRMMYVQVHCIEHV